MGEIPGFLLIAIGVVLLAATLEGGWSSPAIKFLLVSETAVVVSSCSPRRIPTISATAASAWPSQASSPCSRPAAS